MASSVVVKVKYENKLRRFNAAVNGNQQLELDIEGLRAKIRSLFNFTADSELELTYEDEDEDIVALVDEEDLHDVIKQGLNPVRIAVKINTGSAASVRSSGTSTPLPAQDQIYSGVTDLLKTVPEPFRAHLSKLSAQVASRTSSSTPVLAEFIEGITKAADSFLNAHKNEPVKVASASGNERGSHSHFEEAKTKLTGPTKSIDMGAITAPFEAEKKHFEFAMEDSLFVGSSSGKATAALEVEKKPFGRTKEEAKRKVVYKDGATGFAASEAEKIPFGRTKEEARRSKIECPFSGLPMQPPTLFPKVEGIDSQGSIFHRGVQCDGCGVHPITGPRFKSKVKLDYDLCQICFRQIAQMGEHSDYIRIDFPASYRHPWSVKGNPHMHHQKPWSHPPPPLRFFGKQMKQLKPKLDSRFILDVNVMDGTIMAPKTPFTKIWRMRNNGNLPWIHGTQLVWIGGDKFSPTSSVQVEIPVSGFYPENEVDVAVDFIVPELPGRYISYWKMASSSGQKFGQRVWVLIQVDASLSEATSTLPNSLNLNLPPEGTGENFVKLLDTPTEPLTAKQIQQLMDQRAYNLDLHNNDLLYGDDPTADLSSSAPLLPTINFDTPLDQITEERMQEMQRLIDQQYAYNLNLHTNEKPPYGPLTESSYSLPLPTIDVGLSRPTVHPLPAVPITYPQVEVPSTEEAADENTNSEVEDVLLKELEQMGFKQVDMNKKVLKKNEYDFEKSLDELCNVSEWDLLLEEMRGMGFVDCEANKKVLAKNNGSLKHAVMDLINRENV